MSDEYFLRKLLIDQNIDKNVLKKFKVLWKKFDQHFSLELDEKYYMYYGGSYRKNTMIKAIYDLDIVINISDHSKFRIEEFFYRIGEILEFNNWRKIYQNRVSWRIYYEPNFHIDIVPCKYTGGILHESILFNSEDRYVLKTNVDVHEKVVKESKRQDIIRLLKLWKFRKNIYVKTFILEQIAINACKGIPPHKLYDQLFTCFEFIEKNIMNLILYDPANSNNEITDTLTMNKREYLRYEASIALEQNSLGNIFRTKN